MGSRRERARSSHGLQGRLPFHSVVPALGACPISSAGQPSRALTAVESLSFGPASFHLPAFPSLHGRYPLRRYYGRSDFVLGGSSASQRHELRDFPADLPDSCAWSSSHSVSNHLRDVRRWRPFAGLSTDARGFCPPRQASHSARRLAHPRRPNRVHFVRPSGGRRYGLTVLVPLLSTPCCHDAVMVRYRTILHRTEADFHRFDQTPSQAHERLVPPGQSPARGSRCRHRGRVQRGAPNARPPSTWDEPERARSCGVLS